MRKRERRARRRGSSLLLAAALATAGSLSTGACVSGEPDTALSQRDAEAAALEWQGRFTKVSSGELEDLEVVQRDYLEQVDSTLAHAIATHTGIDAFERGHVKFQHAMLLNRLGRFTEATVQFEDIGTDELPIPRTRFAYVVAMNDMGRTADGNVLIEEALRPKLRNRLIQAERRLPADSWSDELDYRIGVLSFVVGDHEDVERRFADPAAMVELTETDAGKARRYLDRTILIAVGDARLALGDTSGAADAASKLDRLMDLYTWEALERSAP